MTATIKRPGRRPVVRVGEDGVYSANVGGVTYQFKYDSNGRLREKGKYENKEDLAFAKEQVHIQSQQED